MTHTWPGGRVAPTLIDHDPFAGHDPHWARRACWPAHWIAARTSDRAEATSPVVAGYRLRLDCAQRATGRVHVSADERFELFVDGALVGRGPDRGDPAHWTFHSYDIVLGPGTHWLAARVWSLGDEAPYAQLSVRHGFLLAAEGFADDLAGDTLDTGVADWSSALLPGHRTRPKGDAWGCGSKHVSDGRAIAWGWQAGEEANGLLSWSPPVLGEPGYAQAFVNDMPPGPILVPAILPPQREEPAEAGAVRHASEHEPRTSTHDVAFHARDNEPALAADWQRLLNGEELTVPADACWRALIDLGRYVCAYPRVGTRGGAGAEIRVHWQESLYRADRTGKGNRDEVEDKLFGRPDLAEDGPGDLFIAGGGEEDHSTLWWEAGRYVEVLVTTREEPLVLTQLSFLETHYPYADSAGFTASDPRLAEVARISLRTLQMCSHETTMDCPYYEQLQYAGDTRLQCLVAYATCDDDRLARQALLAFDRSRSIDGLTQSRTPSRILQRIPPFSLWWVAMVHDFALWRGDLDFVADLMPGVRAVLDAHRRHVDAEGVFHAIDGWNFTDWVDSWQAGAPPSAHWGVSGVLQLQLVHVLRLAAELEAWLDEPELAQRQRRLADRLAASAEERFYVAETGLYADDATHSAYSEHAQCLALLAGTEHGETAVRRMLDPARAVTLAQTTVYFDHYLFEALFRVDRTDVLLDRLGLWFDMLDDGLTTVVEQPEPTRSDCHAWGAHPRFHFVASLLGIRPTAPGMTAVRVTPRLGGLDWAQGSVASPHGPIRVRAHADGTVEVDAPPAVTLT